METSSVEPELEKWSWASGIVIFIDGLGVTTVDELEEVLFLRKYQAPYSANSSIQMVLTAL